MDELKSKGKKVIENIGEKRHDLIQKWEDKSKEFIEHFLLLFGRDGRLVQSSTTKFSLLHMSLYISSSLATVALLARRQRDHPPGFVPTG